MIGTYCSCCLVLALQHKSTRQVQSSGKNIKFTKPSMEWRSTSRLTCSITTLKWLINRRIEWLKLNLKCWNIQQIAAWRQCCWSLGSTRYGRTLSSHRRHRRHHIYDRDDATVLRLDWWQLMVNCHRAHDCEKCNVRVCSSIYAGNDPTDTLSKISHHPSVVL